MTWKLFKYLLLALCFSGVAMPVFSEIVWTEPFSFWDDIYEISSPEERRRLPKSIQLGVLTVPATSSRDFDFGDWPYQMLELHEDNTSFIDENYLDQNFTSVTEFGVVMGDFRASPTAQRGTTDVLLGAPTMMGVWQQSYLDYSFWFFGQEPFIGEHPFMESEIPMVTQFLGQYDRTVPMIRTPFYLPRQLSFENTSPMVEDYFINHYPTFMAVGIVDFQIISETFASFLSYFDPMTMISPVSTDFRLTDAMIVFQRASNPNLRAYFPNSKFVTDRVPAEPIQVFVKYSYEDPVNTYSLLWVPNFVGFGFHGYEAPSQLQLNFYSVSGPQPALATDVNLSPSNPPIYSVVLSSEDLEVLGRFKLGKRYYKDYTAGALTPSYDIEYPADEFLVCLLKDENGAVIQTFYPEKRLSGVDIRVTDTGPIENRSTPPTTVDPREVRSPFSTILGAITSRGWFLGD